MPPKKESPAKETQKKVSAAKKQSNRKPLKMVTSAESPCRLGICNLSEPVQSLNWTKEDYAAQTIQIHVRQFLARKQLEARKKEKQDYETTMERLEQEAYAQMVKMFQEQAELARRREDDERRHRQEMAKRRKRILEAAFEGNNDEILAVLKEIKVLDDARGVGHDIIGKVIRSKNQLAMVECEDANGNTPLSEASSGGHSETIRLLIERGADPNKRSNFIRTPLYRAAFAGHVEAVQTLLELGGDPRLYAEDGQTPEQISTFGALQDVLRDWDVSRTDVMLEKFEQEKNNRAEEDRRRKEAETSKLEDQIATADFEYRTMQKRMCKAKGEVEKRITDHDQAILAGFEKIDITLATIRDAEAELEVVKMDLEKAKDRLAKLKLALRDKQRENQAAEDGSENGLRVVVRELDDVLMKDIGNRIQDSNKWPLVIDVHEQASTFLRYRDTNYINALSPQQMEPERVRLAILGSLRYGKPLVLDMMEVDMFDACRMKFDEVQKGLMDAIMDKSILTEPVYAKLIRASDGEEYSKNQFNDARMQNFKFILLTKSPFPPVQLMESMYPVRVCIKDSMSNSLHC